MKIEIINFRIYLLEITQMDDATFNLCIDFLEIEQIKKGDFFIKEGKTCKSITFINEGLFRIYNSKDGIEVNTCFCKENSITSSFESLINKTPSKETIQALENSTIVTLSFDNLQKLYNLSAQWQSLGRLLTEKECLRLSNRNSALSFETATEKYKLFLRNEPEINQRISIQNIASYIGVSRETLSRIRKKIVTS
ncbi:Crp/Fnr family transcriptional regulator [Lutibacter sp.]